MLLYSRLILLKQLNILHYLSSQVHLLLSLEALILQFKRLANIYFLVIAILQSIPIISPLDPLVAWLPLIVVIGISMAREGKN